MPAGNIEPCLPGRLLVPCSMSVVIASSQNSAWQQEPYVLYGTPVATV